MVLLRLTTARPPATTAENTTPMTVSEGRALKRCMNMMMSPTASPNSGLERCGSTPSTSPVATPAKAEWPTASEKKAMR